ncbi:MAG: TSUP family transporter [Actinomycetes bacterium]
MSLSTAIFLGLAAGFAGFVDAMVGGGGLIQLPALLIGISDKPLPLILGTNKIPSFLGTSSSGIAYFRKVRPNLHVATSMAIPAFIGSVLGARLAASFPKDLFRPIIVILLIAVALYTWKKPHLGMDENLRFTPTIRLILVSLFGFSIGFYDGIFGPGTGTFLVFILVGVIGYAFLKASATAKLVNMATNFGAILSFQFTGHIWWRLGLLMAIANIAGSLLGARLAIRGGSPLVRKVFLAVTTLLIAKVGYDWLSQR